MVWFVCVYRHVRARVYIELGHGTPRQGIPAHRHKAQDTSSRGRMEAWEDVTHPSPGLFLFCLCSFLLPSKRPLKPTRPD